MNGAVPAAMGPARVGFACPFNSSVQMKLIIPKGIAMRKEVVDILRLEIHRKMLNLFLFFYFLFGFWGLCILLVV